MMNPAKRVVYILSAAGAFGALAGCPAPGVPTVVPEQHELKAQEFTLAPADSTTLPSTSLETADGGTRKTASGVEIEIIRPGAGGRAARDGDRIAVHYVGTLEDGSKFDSSRDRAVPFTFQLGKHMVIPGWEQGVRGMTEGEIRKLVIPYQLAYGVEGRPPKIPRRATLVFEVELLQIDGATGAGGGSGRGGGGTP